jgi:hypothetical protein
LKIGGNSSNSLNKSIHSLSKRLDYLDNNDGGNGNGNSKSNNEKIEYWKGKKIISSSEWKKIANHTQHCSFGSSQLRIDEALQYFPNEYNDGLFLFDVSEGYEDKANQWYCDYRELHEHILIAKYGLDTYQKMIEEVDYQENKKQWYFHDSSWYMRRANGYDGKGCNDYTGCLPECEYFKPSLYPELLPLLKECEDNRHLLGRSRLANK